MSKCWSISERLKDDEEHHSLGGAAGQRSCICRLSGFLDERITKALERRGVRQLYSHQASAVRAVHDGKSIVVVTPTASGKTMCYNVPVMDAILKDESPEHYSFSPQSAVPGSDCRAS